MYFVFFLFLSSVRVKYADIGVTYDARARGAYTKQSSPKFIHDISDKSGSTNTQNAHISSLFLFVVFLFFGADVNVGRVRDALTGELHFAQTKQQFPLLVFTVDLVDSFTIVNMLLNRLWLRVCVWCKCQFKLITIFVIPLRRTGPGISISNHLVADINA